MAKSRTNSRRHERSVAVQVLYGLSFAQVSSEEEVKQAFMLSQHIEQDESSSCEEPSGYAWELVLGVYTNREKIDAIISKHSQNWRLNRIGHIELTLLRLAVFELFFHEDIPAKVVINEALELSANFGALQSKKFINGILDAAIKDLDESCKTDRINR